MVRRSKQYEISFIIVSVTVVQDKIFWKINLIDSSILQQNDLSKTKDLPFSGEKLKDDKNNMLLRSMIEFIQSTERFKFPLFQS